MGHPKAIGDRTTLAVMSALHEAGYAILLPFGENTRYDLVIDDGKELRRVQCKTGRLRTGSIKFNACSSYGHHPNPKVTRRSYLGEIDYYGVHCPETGGVYLVPIEDVGTQMRCSLRVLPSKNNQSKGIRPAGAYELETPRLRASSALRASSGARRSSA